MQAKIVNKIIIYLLIFLLGCNILNPSDDNINESIISLFFLNSINTSSTEDTKSPTPGNNGTITTKNFRGDSGHKTGLHASATLP